MVAEPWFHLAQLPAVGERAALEGAEARHAASARRLAAGDRLTLFDGRGGTADAIVHEVTTRPRIVVVDVESRETVGPDSFAVDLLCALPKSDRQGVLISMATQLGMRSLTPLHAERSVARGGTRFAERARRIALEACKQCRRAYLPSIEEPCTPDAVGDRLSSSSARCFVADPGGPPLRVVVGLGAAAPPEAGSVVAIVIGPEGGLTSSELELLDRIGAQRFSLGPRILRIETAATASLAAITTLLSAPD